MTRYEVNSGYIILESVIKHIQERWCSGNTLRLCRRDPSSILGLNYTSCVASGLQAFDTAQEVIFASLSKVREALLSRGLASHRLIELAPGMQSLQ